LDSEGRLGMEADAAEAHADSVRPHGRLMEDMGAAFGKRLSASPAATPGERTLHGRSERATSNWSDAKRRAVRHRALLGNRCAVVTLGSVHGRRDREARLGADARGPRHGAREYGDDGRADHLLGCEVLLLARATDHGRQHAQDVAFHAAIPELYVGPLDA